MGILSILGIALILMILGIALFKIGFSILQMFKSIALVIGVIVILLLIF